MSPPMSRRGLMVGGLTVGGLAVSAGQAPAAAAMSHDPRQSAEGQVKLGASLDESPAWWSYSGVIYAVRPEQRPLAILAISGCASHWAVRQNNGDFHVGGATVSYFRDPTTGAFLDTFDNPFTGAKGQVQANVLTGGGLVYPADGSSAYARGHINAATVAPGGFGEAEPQHPLGGLRWDVGAASVMLMTDRAWNVPVQPQLEAQTQSADKAAFFDPRVVRLPARYAATTIAPWMTWLGMGDMRGHLIWHTSGEKSFSPDNIPADYRRHAGSAMDLLTTRPAA